MFDDFGCCTVGFKGKRGPRGDKGRKGDEGDEGDIGDKGFIGPPGENGAEGLPGRNGTKGKRGPPGLQGDDGEEGGQGMKGDVGMPGMNGDKGFKGIRGDQGRKGNNGVEGVKGMEGLKGFKGIEGGDGDKGSIGENGVTGERGTIGDGGGLGMLLVIHSQTTSTPSCPGSYVKLWDGYSLLHIDTNGHGSGQDLGDPGSCVPRFSTMPFVRCTNNDQCQVSVLGCVLCMHMYDVVCVWACSMLYTTMRAIGCQRMRQDRWVVSWRDSKFPTTSVVVRSVKYRAQLWPYTVRQRWFPTATQAGTPCGRATVIFRCVLYSSCRTQSHRLVHEIVVLEGCISQYTRLLY